MLCPEPIKLKDIELAHGNRLMICRPQSFEFYMIVSGHRIIRKRKKATNSAN